MRILTTNYLKEVTINSGETGHYLPVWMQEKVKQALELPIHWRMARLHTRLYIDTYSNEESMNPTVLELSKLDFNLVQSKHVAELREASRWSKEMKLGEKLPFARDRIVECYFWALGMLPQPKHGYFRINMAKLLYFVTLLDDTYDVYGTIDELNLFTDAIERWELRAMEKLPDYMKIIYLALFNTTNEINYHVLVEKNGLDVATFTKKAIVTYLKSYMQEAKWYHQNYIPTPEEYIINGSISICGSLMLYHTYIMIDDDDDDDKEVVSSAHTIIQFLLNPSFLMDKTSKISRLLDDLATSTDELKRGDVHKAMECHVHHLKISEEEARERIRSVILKTWAEVNRDRSTATSLLPKTVVDATINLVRTFHFFYEDGDGFSSPAETIQKDNIESLLFQPLSI